MISSRAKFVLRCLGSLLLIWLVFRRVDWVQLWLLLRSVDLRLAAFAWTLVLPLILLLALRWRLFLHQQAIPVPIRTVTALTWAGQFFNSVLPGSTGGDIVKVYQMCRLYPDRKAAAATSVIVDRLVALAALMALALFGLWNGLPREVLGLASLPSVPPWLVAAVVGFSAAAVYLGWRYLRNGRAREVVLRVLAPLKVALTPNRYLAVGIVLAAMVHLLNFLCFYLFARALDIEITYVQVLLVVPVLLLCVLVPVTVNGHGLREALLIYYFTLLHISVAGQTEAHTPETVVALSALLVGTDLLWSLPGGIFYLAVLRKQPAA